MQGGTARRENLGGKKITYLHRHTHTYIYIIKGVRWGAGKGGGALPPPPPPPRPPPPPPPRHRSGATRSPRRAAASHLRAPCKRGGGAGRAGRTRARPGRRSSGLPFCFFLPPPHSPDTADGVCPAAERALLGRGGRQARKSVPEARWRLSGCGGVGGWPPGCSYDSTLTVFVAGSKHTCHPCCFSKGTCPVKYR